MKRLLLLLMLSANHNNCFCWGFYAHKKINSLAVFLLPPEMILFYKANIGFIGDHALDPDKRKNVVASEGPKHYIDIDHYGLYPYPDLPHKWQDAVTKYTFDTLIRYGIVPWHIQLMLARLTKAFKEKNFSKILRNSADIGHYIADAHVPLHTNSNHNGQLTNQKGIHAFWESRIPELLAEKERKQTEKRRLAILEAISSESIIDLPNTLVEEELLRMRAQTSDNLAQMNLTFENYLAEMKKTQEALFAEWRPDAQKRVRYELTLANIADTESIAPDEAEVEKEAKHLMTHYKDITIEQAFNYATNQLRKQKTFEFLETLK